jgi:V8-like Glu-specific endopeptidase
MMKYCSRALIAVLSTCLTVSVTIRANADGAHRSEPVRQNSLLWNVNVFSDDPNKPHDPRHAPVNAEWVRRLAPIGVIETNSAVPLQDQDIARTKLATARTKGTAFMISPCYALTNFHAVFGALNAAPEFSRNDYSVTATFDNIKAKGTPVVWGRFYETITQDWAVIRLDPCVGQTTGWFSVALFTSNNPLGLTYSSYGFPDQSFNLTGQDNCHLIRRISNGFQYETDCSSRPGSSGAPIGLFSNGRFWVQAMVSGTSSSQERPGVLMQYDISNANLAVDMYALFASSPKLTKRIMIDLTSNK